MAQLTGVKVVARSVRRYRAKVLLWRGVRITTKPLLSVKSRAARLAFALTILRHDLDVRRVLWTDEKIFKLRRVNGKGRVYIKDINDCARFRSCTTKDTSKVHVWGGIHHHFATPLIIINGTMNANIYMEMLYKHIFPYVRTMVARGHDVVFQQDGSAVHRAHAVILWFKAMKSWLRTVAWPAQSPDLTPIEKIWARMTDLVSAKRPTNKAELVAAVQEAWVEATTTEPRQR
eukprot:gnl/Spiro4/6331_TR3259_c0_g1_i1.p1 gnl/Spiro4/6331_TR3259_c0_g1~~gnl/Spiro4/6331_TR3259_c0_g1_i1.p1  ORF type:complete len:232 (-),score=53.65 gnl/Spiro4/6331_TR3259_c0_g1_i1:111-806(-)